MPNTRNITAPITLVSFGRSGSSTIASAFEHHPDFANAGETTNLIFGAWNAIDCSNSLLPMLMENRQAVHDDIRAARVVRESLLAAVPSTQPHWFHKPIAAPIVLTQRFNEKQWDEAAHWYWHVMRSSFPEARYFTILRNPFDVVLSARAYWRYDESTVWYALGLLSHLLAHPNSPIEFAVSYDDLVRDSRGTLEHVFQRLGLNFHEDMLPAFSKLHVPASDRVLLTPDSMSRQQEWISLNPAACGSRSLPAIEAVFEKFQLSFDRPPQFLRNGVAGSGAAAANAAESDDGESFEETVMRLNDTIGQLNREIESLHVKYRNEFHRGMQQELQGKLARQEAEFSASWRQQQELIEQLVDRNKKLLEVVRSRPPAGMFRRFLRRLAAKLGRP